MFSKPIRISPAMGVALVALAFALSGTSLAQGAATKIGRLISGSSIKKGSIPGNRLGSNSITGKQINEKTLATVPSATRADRVTLADRATNAERATNADNALALGGTAAAGYRTFATRAIPSGVTVTGAFGISSNVTTLTGTPTNDIREVVQLPGVAPADLGDDTINFASAAGAVDVDPACTGTPNAPTAPAGKVCLYLSSMQGLGTTVEGQAIPLLLGSRVGFVVHAANLDSTTGAFGTWAYTAP